MSLNRKKQLTTEALEARMMLTVPNFFAIDANSTSPTFGQEVSPTHFQGQVSGWYFGRST